ncbi:hypothetical protein ACWGQL_09805 [Streptomyces lydicus]
MPNSESRAISFGFRSLWFVVREGGSRGFCTEPGDLFVLCCELSQDLGLGAEVRELVDRLL